MPVRSCHSPAYNPSVASHFALNTLSDAAVRCVLSGLCIPLWPHFVPVPLWAVLSSHSGIFLFFGLMGVFFSVWGICTCYLSLFPGQLFLGSLHGSFRFILHLLAQVRPSQRDFSQLPCIGSPSHYFIPYPPIYFLHCTYRIGTYVVYFLIVCYLIFTIRMSRDLVHLVSLMLRTVPGL